MGASDFTPQWSCNRSVEGWYIQSLLRTAPFTEDEYITRSGQVSYQSLADSTTRNGRAPVVGNQRIGRGFAQRVTDLWAG